MRKYLIIILAFCLCACNDSSDPFLDDNKPPVILMQKATGNGNDFIEGFIDSLKIENSIYTFEYKIEDEETDLSAIIVCETEFSTIEADSAKVVLTPAELGETKITFSTTDGFGAIDTATVSIVAFDNLPPVAVLQVKESEAMLSPFERKIDASESFDRDAKYGGEIVEYEFRVENGFPIRTPNNYRNHIFPGQGSYLILLRVKDSNDVWSETATIRYMVN